MKTGKRILSIFLAVLMLLTAAPLAGFVGLEIIPKAQAYNVGDTIQYGTYPQTRVTDSTTREKLNAQSKNWKSYGYYTGSGSWEDGKMQPGNYMQFADFFVGKEKYRAVTFSAYRPYRTGDTSSASNTYQDNNGYTPNNVYYFKYEPLTWRVLDPSTGYIMCENLIDAQAYQNTIYYANSKYWQASGSSVYANDYATSSIRDWLNYGFFETAFTDRQKKNIETPQTPLDNSSPYNNGKYSSSGTNDKIYLLSYADARNPAYGFNGTASNLDTKRFAKGTDYAQCQGLYVFRSSGSAYNGNSWWWLRSPGYSSSSACNVDFNGYADDYSGVNFAYGGIRPACKLSNLRSDISQSSNLFSDQLPEILENDIVITPKGNNVVDKLGTLADSFLSDGKFATMLNVGMHMNGTTTVNSARKPNFVIEKATNANTVTLSRTEFRDYMIPKDVITSWKAVDIPTTKKNAQPSYAHTATMELDRKDGKPYVSSVFAREGSIGAYTEVRYASLSVKSTSRYDIIISAGGLKSINCRYYIEQDANHKVESSTGVFSNFDLFSKLTYGVDCYAYVVSGGKTSELKKLNFERDATSASEKTQQFLRGSTLDLLGSDFLKFTIPENIPLIGDAEISVNAFKLPAGIEIDGDSVKISVGANIFEHGKELKQNSLTKYKKASNEWFKDWKSCCKNTIGDAYGKTKESWTEAKDNYKKAKQNFTKKWWNSDTSLVNKSKNWDVNALGYIDASLVNGNWVFKEVCLSVAGSFTFKYTQQGAIWVIPAYVAVEAGASLGGDVTGMRAAADKELPFEWDLTIKFEPNLKLTGGIGIDDFANVELSAKATLPISFKWPTNYLNIKLKGEVMIGAQFCIIKAEKTIWSKEATIYDKYFGSARKKVKGVNPVTGEEETYVISYEIADRDYLSNTSNWLGDTALSRKKAPSLSQQGGLVLNNLQTSIFNQAQPQVAAFGDKLLMTWIEDDAGRDSYNRMRLMYSVYDGATWSTPVAVADDGCNDMTPVLASDGKDVYIAWQKVAKQLTEQDCSDIGNLIVATEIYTAKYDSETNSIVNVKRMTNNSCYDYAQSVSMIDGTPVFYWVNCNDNHMDVSADNDLYRATATETQKLKSGLHYVLSVDAASVNGTEEVAYVMDADGDTTTTEDVTVYTFANGATAEIDKGENQVAFTAAFYGDLNGDKTLFVSDLQNVYTVENGAISPVLTEDTLIAGDLQYLPVDGREMLLWTQNEAIGNAVYVSYHQDDGWTAPVKASDTETKLENVDVVKYGDQLFGVCTSTAQDYVEDEERYTDGQTDLCSLTFHEIQDLEVNSIFYDESNATIGEDITFQVYVKNNGTKTIQTASFAVSDTLGTNTTTQMNLNLAPGEERSVDLTYTVPQNYGKTTLSVSVESEEISDQNIENNTTEKQIGETKLVLTEAEVLTSDDSYYVTAMLTNESDVPAEDVTVSAMLDDEENLVDHFTVNTIGARQTQMIEYTVEADDLTFDEETNTAKVYLTTADAENGIIGDTVCFIVRKPEDTVCAHSVVETHEAVAPTCTSVGHSAYSICLGCEEIVSGEDQEIPLATHTSGDVVIENKTDATCTAKGSYDEVVYCTGCGKVQSRKTIVTNALGHAYVNHAAKEPTCEEPGWDAYQTCSRCSYTTYAEKPALGHVDKNNDGKCDRCKQQMTGDDVCPQCGKVHKGFFDKIVGFFHKLIYRLTHLFG